MFLSAGLAFLILLPLAGATAAAILLHRHDRNPTRFGLLPAADPLLNQIKLDGYRFDGKAARKKVQQWWAGEKNLGKAP